MYPLLETNLNKIYENTKEAVRRAGAYGIDITAVTKGTGGHPGVAEAFISGGARALGDSRLQNLKDLDWLSAEKWLLRIPALSEAEDVVRHATLSLNSERAVLEALDREAQKQGRVHDALLMIDIGDLREGWFDADAFLRDMEAISKLKNVRIRGLGTNTNCAGAVIPEPDSYRSMERLSAELKNRFGYEDLMVSGGNTGCWYMIENGTIPPVITNLRLGELLLFGTESSYQQSYDFLNHHIFKLKAEIIELKRKPSKPIGKHGKDAFGNEPVFEDKGTRLRAICALGKQDVSIEDIRPEDNRIEIVTASSDHLILDLTDCDRSYSVGDIIPFYTNYVSTLRASTSEYVNKTFVTQ